MRLNQVKEKKLSVSQFSPVLLDPVSLARGLVIFRENILSNSQVWNKKCQMSPFRELFVMNPNKNPCSVSPMLLSANLKDIFAISPVKEKFAYSLAKEITF